MRRCERKAKAMEAKRPSNDILKITPNTKPTRDPVLKTKIVHIIEMEKEKEDWLKEVSIPKKEKTQETKPSNPSIKLYMNKRSADEIEPTIKYEHSIKKYRPVYIVESHNILYLGTPPEEVMIFLIRHIDSNLVYIMSQLKRPIKHFLKNFGNT